MRTPSTAAAGLALLLAAAPVGAAEPQVTLLAQDDRRDLLIEGVVQHRGRWLVSAIAARTIFAVEHGRLVPFLAPDASAGGVFGMAVDTPRGVLWAAEAWGAGVPGGSGARRTGLLKVSLASGRVLARYPAPAPAVAFGDVVVDPAGAVYASDGVGGGVWTLAPGDKAPRLLVKPGPLKSPQGMVLCPLDAMVVSDYATGLHRVELGDGSTRPLKVTGLKVAGLDGLVTLGRRDVLDVAATYNGDQPYRLMRLTISADCDRLVAAETVLQGAAVRDVALAAAGLDGLGVVTGSQWAGWTGEGARNGADPGPATVALVRLPAQP